MILAGVVAWPDELAAARWDAEEVCQSPAAFAMATVSTEGHSAASISRGKTPRRPRVSRPETGLDGQDDDEPPTRAASSWPMGPVARPDSAFEPHSDRPPREGPGCAIPRGCRLRC
jgi:hypothetical protein